MFLSFGDAFGVCSMVGAVYARRRAEEQREMSLGRCGKETRRCKYKYIDNYRILTSLLTLPLHYNVQLQPFALSPTLDDEQLTRTSPDATFPSERLLGHPDILSYV